MKRVLLWLAGVALGAAVLLAAVTGASFALTTPGHLPSSAAQFGGGELEPNGWRWRAPLIGGRMDRVFSSPPTLAVQKLGVLYDAHPALTLPDWATDSQLTIENEAGQTVFSGSCAQYEDFLYPSNGGYKAQLTLWRLAPGQDPALFDQEAQGSLRPNPGLERPARPAGWYRYSFRFTVQASPVLELSAERVDQGGVIGLQVTGMAGDAAPLVETDLGRVDCVRCTGGWRGYIPAAYNASAGAHTIRVTAGGQVLERTVTVIPRDFGTAEAPPEPAAPAGAAEQFRGTVWPLYEQPPRDKLWQGGFVCPAADYMVLVDFGQVKLENGVPGAKSNSTRLYTIPGEAVRAPADGVVVLAKDLDLTGSTVVIDHGCGLRSYLYGLGAISVAPGQTVTQGQAVGALGEELTMDFKLGSRSISPWPLFQTSGGLFWRQDS